MTSLSCAPAARIAPALRVFTSTDAASPSSGAAAVAGRLLPAFSAGVVFGISFVAQPSKFATPGADRLQLIAAGSTIFWISHLVQYVLLFLLSVLTPPVKRSMAQTGWCIGLFGYTLLLQHLWLLPALDGMLYALQAGRSPDARLLHTLYVMAEVFKLALLVLLAASPLRTRQACTLCSASGPPAVPPEPLTRRASSQRD